MNRVAVYVRVSTSDQEKGIDSQKRAIRQYLKATTFPSPVGSLIASPAIL